MSVIIGKVWQGYQFLFNELPDPRTKGWFLVSKPYQVITLLVLYLMFVLKWGPKFMKGRQPFNVDKLLIVYNAFQVAACLYLFNRALYLAWGWDYKWICEPVDFSYKPRAIEIASLTYLYFLLKVIDLLDTVFFVLRKKFNQVSFLHIYHHTGMVLLIWAAVTYLPGGHGTLVGVINSFIHVVMYTYYMLSVAIPDIKNMIWIKKFVTQLQILQFFLCVVHMGALVFKSDCEYPRWTSAVFLPQNLFMLVLFIDFYIKTYVRKPRQQLIAQINQTKVSNPNNDKENNNIHKNSIPKEKIENDTNKFSHGKETNDVKNYLINDLSKLVNSHSNDVSYSNNNNGFSENVNIFENAKEKSSCSSGKCKINCHKHYKNE